MAKLVTTDLSSIVGAESTAITTINNNFAAVETALENTLSRDGTSPNTMSADIDLNSNDLLNVGTIEVETLTIGGEELTTELFAKGDPGDPGNNGWSPQFAVVADSARRVLQLTGWFGGTGTTPTTHVGEYVGSTGFTATLANGVDIRGAAGAGTGDMLAAQNLNDLVNKATAFTNIKQAATTSATGVAELATDAEAQAKTDTARVITPSNLAALGATSTFAGLVELATLAEVQTGTDTVRAVTPAGVAGAFMSGSVTQFSVNNTGSLNRVVTLTGGPFKFLYVVFANASAALSNQNLTVAVSDDNGSTYSTPFSFVSYVSTGNNNFNGHMWIFNTGTVGATKYYVPEVHRTTTTSNFSPASINNTPGSEAVKTGATTHVRFRAGTDKDWEGGTIYVYGFK